MLAIIDLGFRTLTPKSINQTLTGMCKLAVVSGAIQAVLFPVLLSHTAGMENSGVIVPGTLILWFCLALRLAQQKYGHLLYPLKNGYTIWRVSFFVSSTCISGVWGLTTAYAFSILGMTPGTSALIMICMGTTSLFAASYPLDLPNNIFFQLLMILPTAFVLIFAVPEAGSNALALAGFLFLIFSVNMAVNLSKSLIQTLRNVEILEEQDLSLRKAHNELRANHELINAMLANIDQAFLILDFQGRCMNIASQRSRELLGMDPLGKGLSEILRMDEKQTEELHEWYEMLTGDKVGFDIVRGLGPKMLNLDQNGTNVEVNFHPLRSGDGKLYAVIMTAFDVTLELQAASEIQAAKERAELIVRVIENRLAFRGLLAELDKTAARMAQWDNGDFAKLRLDLHTLKGSANMFGALAVGQAIYEAELKLKPNSVREQGEWLKREFNRWKNIEHELFTKLGVYDGAKIEVAPAKIKELQEKYSKDAAGSAFFKNLLRDLMYTEFADLLKTYENNVRFAAQKTGKVVQFIVKKASQPLYVMPETYRDVLNTLVHMMNNAVDHGIESAEERLQAGKPETGTIALTYRTVKSGSQDFIEIEIQDDGSGVNVAKVRQKLERLGRGNLASLSDLEVANHIFDEGLSTRDNVSAISGQGIGMSAVHDAVVGCGGEISIKSTGPQGTLFQIRIPMVSASSPGLPVAS